MSTTTEPVENELVMLKDRLDKLQKELEAQRRSASHSTTLTAIVGAIILLLISAYFIYGYQRFRSITEPEKVVDVAQAIVDENLPRVRDSVEKEIAQSAPKWAEGLSRKAQDSMPDVRKKAVQYLTDEADKKIQEASLMTEKTFREFLTKNRAQLEQKYKEIAASPQLAEKSLSELQLCLDDQMSTELRLLAADAIRSISSANRNLIRLQDGKSLTPEQQVERQVWMLVRRLQMENLAEAERIRAPIRKVATPENTKETAKDKKAPEKKESDKKPVEKKGVGEEASHREKGFGEEKGID
jgi:hypothetical protein